MNNQARVAIIGGGVAGLSVAWNLTELGCQSVVLIERDHLISGSSGLSVGVFTRQYTDPLDIDLRVYSYKRMEELETAGDITFNRIGYLRLAHDEATLAAFEQSAALQRDRGALDSRVLDREELRKLVPHMRCDDLTGALYGPSDGYLDGHVLCRTYAERAERAGARLLQQTAITDISGGRGTPFQIHADRELIEADVVVNAAGAWAAEVGKMLSAPVPVLAQREQVCLGRFGERLPYTVPFLMDYVVGSLKPGLYLRDEGHGQFVAGMHTNEPTEEPVDDPDDFNRSVDAQFVEAIAEELLRRFPTLTEMGLKEGWVGLYPLSPDGRPILGPHPDDPGVIVLAGLGGAGIHISPALGRLAAEQVMSGQYEILNGADALGVGRFASSAI